MEKCKNCGGAGKYYHNAMCSSCLEKSMKIIIKQAQYVNPNDNVIEQRNLLEFLQESIHKITSAEPANIDYTKGQLNALKTIIELIKEG